MHAAMLKQRVATLLNPRQPALFAAASQRSIASKATYQQKSEDVNLRGEFLPGRAADLPTLIWFADLCEPASNFKKFFTGSGNRVLDHRNVWLLNYRNFGDSDHHDSFDLHDMSNDVVRFMDKE